MLKLTRITIVVLWLSSNIFAQEYSVAFNYSGLVTGVNNESTSIYVLEGNYKFKEYNFTVGIDITLIDGYVNFNSLNHSSIKSISRFNEQAPSIGINMKYYPSLFNSTSPLKPYIGFGLGWYLYNGAFGIFDIRNLSCEESYTFSNSDYSYINFEIGSSLFLNKYLSFILGLQYQIRNPKITYKKPNCFDDKSTTYTEYREKVNLGMLLWSIGVQVNL